MFVDFRHALRLLVRSPLFTATAVLSLAIGIGATTTVFTLADALLLRRPIGVTDPDRVVDIGRTRNGREFDNSSYPNFQDIAAQAKNVSGVYAIDLEPILRGARRRAAEPNASTHGRQRQLLPGPGRDAAARTSPHAGR